MLSDGWLHKFSSFEKPQYINAESNSLVIGLDWKKLKM